MVTCNTFTAYTAVYGNENVKYPCRDSNPATHTQSMATDHSADTCCKFCSESVRPNMKYT